jgi:hypothetical protein
MNILSRLCLACVEQLSTMSVERLTTQLLMIGLHLPGSRLRPIVDLVAGGSRSQSGVEGNNAAEAADHNRLAPRLWLPASLL